MSDDDPDRHITAFPELSDNISDFSLTIRDNLYPDIPIFARVGEACDMKSPDASGVKSFTGKLDTGAKLCLLAEHVVADRFGLQHIDKSRWMRVDDLGDNGVRTIGEIELLLLFGSRRKWLRVPFQVIPDSHVRYRFDALLSDKFIKDMRILVLGPDYQ